jgi:3-hydroxyacyl-CoA dehydrogenase
MAAENKMLDATLVESNPDPINLDELKRAGKIFKENAGASILDIGDGISLLEFHTKANSLNDEICEMIMVACGEGARHFDALVIGNRGKHFCAGANLPFVLVSARAEKWADVEKTLRAFQTAAMTLKHGPLPVVAAPFSGALGGGCEVCLHSTRVVASESTHLGLVETGVGLIPAGGGTKELGLHAHYRAAEQGLANPLPALQKSFELIAYAKVSRNGTEAKQIFLTDADSVVVVQESPIAIAKQAALELVRSGHRNGPPQTDVPVLGTKGLRVFQSRIQQMREAKTISEHDAVIQLQVATILCGGNQPAGIQSEQHFLDLEREAFLSLLGTKKTQERIEFLLKNGRPLRN